MRILIDSQIFLPNIFRDIAVLTDKAKVILEKIEFNKDNKSIRMPIKRKNIGNFKSNIFFSKGSSIVKDDKEIASIIIIENVIDFEIKDNSDGMISEFMILFGIKISEREIYISSVEESRGNNLIEIIIKVEKIKFELCDLE